MPKTSLATSYEKVGPRRHRYGSASGPFPTSDVTDYVVAEARNETRLTSNTPGYRNSKGALYRESFPMNPFTYSLATTLNPYGVSDQIHKPSNTRDRFDGFLFGAGGPTNFELRGITPGDRTRLDAEATLAALSDLKGQRVNIGVTLGERRQTSGLILDTAKRLGASYRALKRGDIKGGLDALGNGIDAARVLRDMQGVQRRGQKKKGGKPNRFSLSSEVLAVQLGWKPLLGDVYNYAELLASKANDPVRLTSTSSRTFKWSGNYEPDAHWNGVHAERREWGSVTVKYVHHFSVTNDFTRSLAELGITNPASWLWELTALSFVVDWFIRIGDFIDALDATVGLTFEKGCKTTFEKSTVRYHCKGSAETSTFKTYVQGTASKLRVDCVRTPLTGFPGIPPIVRGSGLNWSRSLTAGALIRQLFKK